VRLWPWGDAVLAADLRKIWMFDAQTGDQRFEVDIAAIEERNNAKDNPDRMTVQIDRVVPGDDRAMVCLGTATIAIDRTGQSAWRVPRGFDDGRRTPPPVPFVLAGGYVITRDSGANPRLTARMTGNGGTVWQVSDTFAKGNQQPPPPPGGPGGEPDESWQRVEGRVQNDTLVLRVGSEIQIRSLSTGRLLWHFPSQTPVAGVELAFGAVIVAADRLVGRRVDNGNVLWDLPMRGARVAVAGDVLAVMHDGGLSLVDKQGRVLWDEQYPINVRETALDRLFVHEQTAQIVFRPKGGGPGGRPGGPPPGGKPMIDVVGYRLL